MIWDILATFWMLCIVSIICHDNKRDTVIPFMALVAGTVVIWRVWT
jgi:hypothetical protein